VWGRGGGVFGGVSVGVGWGVVVWLWGGAGGGGGWGGWGGV